MMLFKDKSDEKTKDKRGYKSYFSQLNKIFDFKNIFHWIFLGFLILFIWGLIFTFNELNKLNTISSIDEKFDIEYNQVFNYSDKNILFTILILKDKESNNRYLMTINRDYDISSITYIPDKK